MTPYEQYLLHRVDAQRFADAYAAPLDRAVLAVRLTPDRRQTPLAVTMLRTRVRVEVAPAIVVASIEAAQAAQDRGS